MHCFFNDLAPLDWISTWVAFVLGTRVGNIRSYLLLMTRTRKTKTWHHNKFHLSLGHVHCSNFDQSLSWSFTSWSS